MRTTFFTCCNKEYEDFIPIFAHSILYHNEDADVEIGVEHLPENDNILSSINDLQKMFPQSKIKVRKSSFDKIIIDGVSYNTCPNVVRFIETPEIANEFVYICDIDIITLQRNITDIHIKNMKDNGIEYSNIVRPYTDPRFKRLTGLHFTKWNSYYPIPPFIDLIKGMMLNHDEVFLYNLVFKKNIINEELTFRPVHGIHCSPNRPDPHALIGWGIKNWQKEWIEYRNDKTFLKIEKFFSDRIINNIQKIDNVIDICNNHSTE